MAMHGASEGCYIFGSPDFFLLSDTFLCLQARNLSSEKRSLFSGVSHLGKIILIVQATNAILERGFSTFEEG